MNPLKKTLQGIQQVSDGNLLYRIPSAPLSGDMHTLVDTFNKMLDRLQELTVSRKQLLAATEEERSRIGRELHDGISQTLVGARFKLESMDTSNANQERQRSEILHHLALAQQDIQRIVKALQPAMIHDHNLADALHCFARQNSNGHKITLDFGLEEQDIPLSLHIPIFRIVQEATNNALRHGDALHINIQLNKENDAVNLFIEDDGRGFNPAEAKQGNGLTNIQVRAAAENGELTIDSAPGRGCCIVVSFPL
jgi:signal transduction histidine kinase